MPPLAIWAIIIGCLILLAEMPCSIIIGYNDDFILKVRFGFITIPLLPKKKPKTPDPRRFSAKAYRRKLRRLELKKKRRLERAKKRALKKSKKNAKKKAGAKTGGQDQSKSAKTTGEKPDVPELIRRAAQVIITMARTFGRRFRIKASRLHLTLATDDAAKTALLYGAVSQSMAYLMEALNRVSHFSYNQDEFSLSVDFCSDKIKADVYFVFTLRSWHFGWMLLRLLGSGTRHALGYLGFMRKKKKQGENDAKDKDKNTKVNNDGTPEENGGNQDIPQNDKKKARRKTI